MPFSIRRSLIILSLVLLPSASVANAAPYIGLDAFAAMHPEFPCQRWLRSMQDVPNPSMAVLWGTFGTSRQCMNSFEAQKAGQPHLVYVYVSNQTCYRDGPFGSCREGELVQGINQDEFNRRLRNDDPALRDRVIRRVQRIINWWVGHRTPGSELVLSTGLEDNFGRAAFKKMVALIRAAGWTGRISRNPAGSTYKPFPTANLLELHPLHTSFGSTPDFTPPSPSDPAARPGFCIANMDGVSIDTPSNGGYPAELRVSKRRTKRFLSRFQDCFAVLIWHAALQGIDQVNEPSAPRSRTFRLPRAEADTINCILRNFQSSLTCP